MRTIICRSPKQFRSILAKCSGKRVVLDTETTGLYWWRDTLTTVGFFCPDAGLEGAIDIVDSPELAPEVKQIVQEVLDPSTVLIFHNAKFDMSFLGFDPDNIPWLVLDTTIMIHLLDSRYKKGMEAAERRLLGTNSKREHLDDAQWPDPPLPKGQRKKRMVWQLHPVKRQMYCINDCRVTYQFAEVIMPMLRELSLEKVFAKECRYLKLVYKVEHRGFLIDPAFVGRAKMALQAHLTNLVEQLYDACGYRFNWRSPKQLSKAIYEDLGIEKPENPFAKLGSAGTYTSNTGVTRNISLDSGKYNDTLTSSFILMEKAHHPLGELISSIREADLLIKTLGRWLDLMDENCVIHSNFNMTGTRTGRLSSSKPNIQNVASDVRSRFTQGVFSGGNTRAEEYNLRNAFLARPGYVLLSIDYKQMEMRMFGISSQDPFMLNSLNAGRDVHADIAEKVWGVRDEVHREWSKTISFGLIYGMTTGSLQFKLGMTKAQARKVTDSYWAEFPRIRPWFFEIMNNCKRDGFLRYWSGRIWKEEDEGKMYKGGNALIQGGCADLLSIAALRADEWLVKQARGCGIVNFVHDELIMEVPEDLLMTAAREVGTIMRVPDLLGTPFLTDPKAGPKWGSMEKFKLEEKVPA